MRAVIAVEDGILELNFMWLPSCMGMNTVFQEAAVAHLSEQFVGRTLDDAALDEAHRSFVEFAQTCFPTFQNLDVYLNGLLQVESVG